MKIKIFLSITILFLLGCFNNQKEAKDNNKERIALRFNSDSLLFNSKEKLEVSKIERNKDTLKMILMNRIVFYPLGKFQKIQDILTHDKNFSLAVEIDKSSLPDSIKLYKVKYKESFVKFFKDEDSNNFEIVSGKITDAAFMLDQNVHIGLKFKDFLNLYYKKDISSHCHEINVVELVSGVDGIWHFYNFKNDILTSIKFNSDYTFDKN
jgi:hypothetical protein